MQSVRSRESSAPLVSLLITLVIPLASLPACALGETPAAPGGTEKVVATGPSTQNAIDSVYPALVQVFVLTISHGGGRERKYESAGSGAIISEDGLVVTNHHVAGKAKSLKCVLPSREEVDATLVGTDAQSDIAVLRLDLGSRPKDAPPIRTARFGRSSTVKVGDTVLAMGCPLALSQSVTEGIVSNIDMVMPRRYGRSLVIDGEDVGALVRWIGHDALVQPGNSGGPLVNLDGEIIGINEIRLGFGMSGAIPSDLVRVIVDELIEDGKIRRPWFGAEFQPLLKDFSGTGVLVSGVIPGSPAEKAGIQPGDVVLAIGDKDVNVRFPGDLPPFNAAMMALDPEEPVTLRIRRGDSAEETVSLVPELRDAARGKEVETNEWGLTVREMTTMAAKRMRRPDKRGVIVGSVRDGWAADKAEPSIHYRDVIVGVGGKAVETLDGFLELTAEIVKGKSKPVPTPITFDRGSKTFLTLVKLGLRKPQDPTPEVHKAWFPAATQVLSKKLAKAIGLKGKKGVRLTQVYPESQAEKAGFEVGDILTHLDGQMIDASEPQDAEVFETLVRAYRIGTTVEITVIRNGETLEIPISLTETPKPERELKVHRDLALEFKARDISYFDRIERRLDMDETGVLVTQVESGGWAENGRLRTGYIIKRIEGRPVQDMKALQRELERLREERPRHVSFFVKIGIRTRFLELEPAWPEKPGLAKPKEPSKGKEGSK